MISQSSAFDINLKFLYYGGFYNTNENSNYYYLCFWIWLIPVQMVFFIPQFITVFTLTGELKNFVNSVYLVITTFTGIVKMVQFYTHRKDIKQIMSDIDGSEFNPDFDVPSYAKLFKAAMKDVRFFSMTYYVVGSATIGLFAVSPVFDHTKYILNSDNTTTVIGRKLPIPLWLPFDITDTNLHSIIWLQQAVGVIHLGLMTVSVDTFVTGLFSIEAEQLKILGFNYAKIGQGIDTTYEEIDRQVRKCIKHHLKILKVIKTTEEIFNMTIVAQCCSTAFIMCISVLMITLTEPFTVVYFTLLLYLFCIIFEIFMYCHQGHKIITESENLYRGIYHSNWYNLKIKDVIEENYQNGKKTTNKNNKTRKWNATGKSPMIWFGRNVIMIMQHIKKPISVTAGKLFVLRYETFVSIIRAGYSYYTLMGNMNK